MLSGTTPPPPLLYDVVKNVNWRTNSQETFACDDEGAAAGGRGYEVLSTTVGIHT